MGKIKGCSVAFKQGQEVFRDGERVVGVVVLEVTEPVAVKGVRVFCHGLALTKWSKEWSRDWDANQISTEKYFSQVCTLFGKKVNQDGPNPTLSAGKHRWNFAFRLPPDRLPSSFEGQHGAIRWFLKVEVDKPFPSINNTWYKPFTVLSYLDLNQAVYKPPIKKAVSKTVSKTLMFGNAGELTLSASTDHFGYCPGETILLNVEAKNESSKDMGKILIKLVQKVVFTANDETKSTSQDVADMQTELSLAKETTMTLTDIQLRIPLVPPSTRSRTCHIISCTYGVQVAVHVPWGLDLETFLPVAIGTVPRGHRLPSAQRSQTQGAAARPANTIQYARCETGFTSCSKSHDTFPNLSYIPCTALHTPAPTQTPPQAAAAAPSQHQQQQQQQQQQQGSKAAMSAGKTSTVMQVPAGVSAVTPVPPGVAGTMGPLHSRTYTPPSAPPAELMDPPPSYEEIMRMEEQRERAEGQTTSSATAATNAAAKPEGRKCVIVLARFPDSALASFRQAIRQEQNSLLDSDQAFLAALSPHPLSSLDKAEDNWPDHTALALLVFPDDSSVQEWVGTVAERRDAWYTDCDMLMLPASWTLPSGINDRLVFSVSQGKMREDADQNKFISLIKSSAPVFIKLREKHEGVHQALSKATTTLHGTWASCEHTVGVIWWPDLPAYMAYFTEKATEEYAKQAEAVRTYWESQTVLLFSEDLTSLSTQSATTLDDDVTAGEDDDLMTKADDIDEENADGENERVENLLDDGKEEQTIPKTSW